MPRRSTPLPADGGAVAGFARELRALRARAGSKAANISEISARLGVPRSTLYAALQGNRLPSPETLTAFVRACGGDEAEWLAKRNIVESEAALAAMRPGPAKWFIGAATSSYPPASGLHDLPGLSNDVDRMAELFIRLGYDRAPGFDGNHTAREFEQRVLEFLTNSDLRADDAVVIYYAGHLVVQGDEVLLPMADATGKSKALAVSDLVDELSRSGRVRPLLLLLDTCQTAGSERSVDRGFRRLSPTRATREGASLAVVLAARPTEQAASGEFTRAFEQAVGHPSSGGSAFAFLPLDGLVGIVNSTTPPWQHARLFSAGDGAADFIPNPRLNRYLLNLDLQTQALQRQRAARSAEERDHVLPRAQGLDHASSETDDLWMFTGRHQALHDVSAWLGSRPGDGPATMVVTGNPGSGKSALLARLYVLSDPRLRARVPAMHTLPASTIPPTGTINRFIHARGLTRHDVMAALCEAYQVEATDSPGQFLSALADRTDPTVVIIDGVDEAIDPMSLVDQLLAPLVRAARRTTLRLLVGARRHLLSALGQPILTIDLDDPHYADVDDVRKYARSWLVDWLQASPYRSQPSVYVSQVADAVANAAGGSFLAAAITARSLAMRKGPVDPNSPLWRGKVPRLVADAMRDDLDSRLGPSADRARDLMLPLAYAHGAGLPWEDIWPALARALSGVDYTSADIDWLIENAGFYLAESVNDDGVRSVYRLYHSALAEHIHEWRRRTRGSGCTANDERIIVDTLIAQVPRLPDGQPDWQQAHPYTKAYVAAQDARAAHLDSSSR